MRDVPEIATQNFYERLAVQPTASQEEISIAFRRLARIYHPDRLRAAADGSDIVDRLHDDMFKLLSEAYTVLSHIERRKEYDRLLALTPEDSGWQKPGPRAKTAEQPSDGTGPGADDEKPKRRRLDTKLDLRQLNEQLAQKQEEKLQQRLTAIAAQVGTYHGQKRRPTFWQRVLGSEP